VRSPLLRLLLIRGVSSIATLLVVSVVVFAATLYLPGDPARAALGAHADPAAVAALRHQFGMDRPAVVQYFAWIDGIVHGDFGKSIPSGDPVWGLIAPKAKITTVLTLSSLALLIPLSFILGLMAAIWKDRIADHAISIPTIVSVALPEFVVGTMLIVCFAVWLRWLPPVSLVDDRRPLWAQAGVFILPVLTLLGTTLAQVVRMVRAVAIDVLNAEYVYMAHLRGLSPMRVVLFHVLPNVVSPTIQTIALNAAWLAGGVVVTETVFQLPGIGSALAEAVIDRDIPTVLAITLIITVTYVLINLIAEVLILVMNPRLRVKTLVH
jgi:peptide/nickel transport system permease protein